MDRRWFLALALLAFVGILYAATLDGTVKSVDAAKHSAVVTGADGKDTTVTWDEKTEVTVDGKKGGAADVKAGAKVTVTHEGGKASKIAVHK
jgi:hypothetical protein